MAVRVKPKITFTIIIRSRDYYHRENNNNNFLIKIYSLSTIDE